MARVRPRLRSDVGSSTPITRSLSKSQVKSPETSLWQSPFTWGATAAVLGTLLVPVWLDSQVPRVLAIAANDQSSSGLAVHVQPIHCKAIVRHLKQDDQMVTVNFANRSEITQDKIIHNTITLLQQCQESQSQHPAVPASLGTQPGTSPVMMLNQVIAAITSKRAQGIHNPAVVTIWLQAAEPVPGDPPLDFTQLQAQVRTITSDRGVVAVIGPTGQLQSDLMTALKDNPRARVCPLSEVDECVDWAYQMGRQSPATSSH